MPIITGKGHCQWGSTKKNAHKMFHRKEIKSMNNFQDYSVLLNQVCTQWLLQLQCVTKTALSYPVIGI